MRGQENNSTESCRFYMKGQAISREKAFVPGPGTMMISSHQLSINRKSTWPFVSKLIPGESPAHDASFCIWKHFRNDFVDSATVTSLPTVSHPALLLPRGVGTLNSCLFYKRLLTCHHQDFWFQDVADEARNVFRTKAPNARTRQVNLNQILYQFSQSGFQPIEK